VNSNTDVIAEIKSRLDLRQLVEEMGTHLKGSGPQKHGLCPFHGDKHPSLDVTPKLWICRSGACARGGDAFTWLEEHGLSFPDALQQLATRTGVVLPPTRQRKTGPSRSELETLQAAAGWASHWYQGQLGAATPVHELLAARQIPPELADVFGLGAAPPFGEGKAWDQLAKAAVSTPHLDALQKLRLVRETRTTPPRPIDQFRSRLVFPIFNWAGKVVGFSARLVGAKEDDKSARYVNSEDSDLFKKGDQLYGLFQARRAIREQRRVIVVEGNIDVLAMHAAGYTCTVAPCGTALTAEQADQLVRSVGEHNQVVVMLDGDRAGHKAVASWLPLLLVHPVDVMVVRPPDELDPSDLWVKGGRELIDECMLQAQPGIDVLLQAVCPAGSGATPATKAKATGELRELLARCNPVMQSAFKAAAIRWLGVEPRLFDTWLSGQAGTATAPALEQIIVRAGETHLQTAEAARALKARHPNIFSRAGQVVRVEKAAIRVVSPKSLPVLLESSAKWLKESVDRKTQEVVIQPTSVPQRVSDGISSGLEHDVLQPLDAVLDIPFLRPDMTIHATPGYDVETQLYLAVTGRMVPVIDNPTRHDADAAMARIFEIYQDFPFATAQDGSGAIAALLTSVARPAFPLAPMFVFDAPKQGTGKSRLHEVCTITCTGKPVTGITLRRDPDKEWRDIEGLLLGGARFLVFDNQEDDALFNNPNVEKFLTGPSTTIRPFSSNQPEDVPNSQTLFMSANNVTFKGGIARRIIRCRLDAKMEKPHLRTGFAIKDLLGHVKRNRQQIAVDCLTVLRAAHLAGVAEGEGPAPLGSFEQWDRVVRRAMLWLGLPDPVQADLDNNAEAGALATFLESWKEVFGFTPVTARTTAEKLEKTREIGNAADFIATLLGTGKRKGVTEVDIGRRIQRFLSKPEAGLVLYASKPKNKSTFTLRPHHDPTATAVSQDEVRVAGEGES
jgi:DNA primase catalytic core